MRAGLERAHLGRPAARRLPVPDLFRRCLLAPEARLPARVLQPVSGQDGAEGREVLPAVPGRRRHAGGPGPLRQRAGGVPEEVLPPRGEGEDPRERTGAEQGDLRPGLCGQALLRNVRYGLGLDRFNGNGEGDISQDSLEGGGG